MRGGKAASSAARRMRSTSLVGGVLLACFLLQSAIAPDWGPLARWQADYTYRLVTGSLLGAFIAFQWLLAWARTEGRAATRRRIYSWHQIVGAATPVFFFVHSTTLGYGYLLLLSVVYFANNALGLANPGLVRSAYPLAGAWVVAHITLSAAIVILGCHHLWTALSYE